jgi:hypothetical protein
MNTSTTTNNTGFSMFSSLPTTEYLYARNPDLRESKNIISLTHFLKIVGAMHPSHIQETRLVALCVAYNALTGEQQRAQNEAHLSAEDDYAVFTDEDGICIIQHDPTYTTFKVLGFDGVEMTTRTML